MMTIMAVLEISMNSLLVISYGHPVYCVIRKVAVTIMVQVILIRV